MDERKRRGILNWFSRWPRWLYFAVKEMRDINLSTDAAMEYVIPATLGSIAAIAAIFSPMIFAVLVWDDPDAVLLFISAVISVVAPLAYFAIGLMLFFNERLQTSNMLPWYENGAW